MSKWEKVKWGEIIEIKNGRNQKDVEDKDGIYPIYGSGGIMGYANSYLNNEDSVIIGRKGNINKPIYVTEKFWNVDTAFALQANKSRLLPKFLYYFCEKYDFEKLNTTVTIPSLTKSNLLNIEISLPPLEIQKQIAKVMETTAELLAMRKQQLAELDNLIKSLFYEMFGDSITSEEQWEVSQLQKMIDENYIVGHLDGNHGNLYPKNAEFVETGIPYIGANCIDGNKVNYNKAKYLSVERASQFRKGVAIKGDVLFAHNATVGPVAILETLENYVILSTSLTFYRCNPEKINNIYLMCYMKSPMFVGQYSIEMGQTTRNQVPISTQRRFLFLLPPLDLQNQFAEIVTKIEEQKALVKKAIDETQLLFDSLMSEYFD